MSQYKIVVRDDDGTVVHESGFAASATMTVELVTVEEIPVRNPLHEQALTRDDLQVGMFIELHKVDGEDRPKRAIVKARPRIQTGSVQQWIVPVVTTDLCGKILHTSWDLKLIGVMPEQIDPCPLWSEWNYVLDSDG